MAQILFENQDLVIVFKPAGVLSVPARTSDDPRKVLGRELEAQLKTVIFPVHRLDYEVSGLIIYAKNSGSHQILNSWFETRKIKKTYRAMTAGPFFSHFPKPQMFDKAHENLDFNQEFRWTAQLFKGKKRVFESPQGKESVTLARAIETRHQYQIWELNPVTGRSHQLRWELSRHGYPILGDTLYGSKIIMAENTIALRAVQIDFSGIQNENNNLNLPQEFRLEESLYQLNDLKPTEA